MRTIRVATYNIHKCAGVDGRTLPGRIAAVIEELNPDIIGLQEVLSHRDRAEHMDQATYLGRRLGYAIAEGEARLHRGGSYGNVILSRHQLERQMVYDLTVPGREPRTAQRADIRVDGQILHFFNLHLGTGFFERRRQAHYLQNAEWLRTSELEGPRIVVGDLNEWTAGHVTRLLSAELACAHLRHGVAWRRRYPALLPLLQLDFIYTEPSVSVWDAFYHQTPRAFVASDHLPMAADVSLPG